MQRLIRWCAVSLVAAVAAGPALARADSSVQADPIDRALDRCLAAPAAGSTAGMVSCLDTAYGAWDKELNTVYRALSASLDPKSRALLQASQRQWIAFRDAERKFWQGPWTADEGTLIQITLGQTNVDLVKARVLTLRGYSGP